jgi:hypothetical protein
MASQESRITPIITAQILASGMLLLGENRDYAMLDGGYSLVNFDGQVWLCAPSESVSLDEAEKLVFVCCRHDAIPSTETLGWVNLDPSQIPTDDDKAAALGWELYHSGGGCMAYVLELGVGGAYLLATDSDGCSPIDKPENWAKYGAPQIGLYNVDGEELFGAVVGNPFAAGSALAQLAEALYACELAGVSVVAEIDAETPDGCFLKITHGETVLWSGLDHGGQHYLNGAAAELARMGVK